MYIWHRLWDITNFVFLLFSIRVHSKSIFSDSFHRIRLEIFRNSKESLSVKTLSSASRTIQTWPGESLLVMNRGYSNTIPRPNGRVVSEKARMSKSKIKVMLIAFFDIKGIVHLEFLPQGQTVNQYVYNEILRRLRRSVWDKRRGICGRTTPGCFTMTTPLLTVPWTSDSFCRRGTCQLWSNPRIRQTWPLVIFPIAQAQEGDQGDPISWCGGHQNCRDDGAQEDSRRSLPGVHRSVEEEDGQVCETGGKLFWRVKAVISIYFLE